MKERFPLRAPLRRSSQVGFSLVELVAILLIVGVLAATVMGRMSLSADQKLIVSRDATIIALLAAQQRAMNQVAAIRLDTTGNALDLQEYDGSDWRSLFVGGVQYPILFKNSQTITGDVIEFNRLGRTAPRTLVLTRGSASIAIDVAASGFSH